LDWARRRHAERQTAWKIFDGATIGFLAGCVSGSFSRHPHIIMTDQHLKQEAQTILASFLKQRQSSNDDIAQDVYRTIRDEANLLLERESICNVLDSDPFGMTKPDADDDEDDVKEKTKNADMIERVKVGLCMYLTHYVPLIAVRC
jgi:hypothetical protein